MRFDVGVVGGGAIGLACAWRLAQGGARVTVYEQNRVGKAATHAAGGMLAAQSERAGHPLLSCPPESRDAFFGACLQSRALYPGFAGELLEFNLGGAPVDIELSQQGAPIRDWREPGILFIADHRSPGERERIGAEFDAQQRAGLGVEERTFERAGGAESAEGESPAFWLADEGQVESRSLAPALRLACERDGVQIFERARVRREGSAWTVDGDPMEAQQVLVCGGAWSGLLWSSLTRPLAGQMIVLKAERAVKHIHYGSRAYLIPRRSGLLLVGATQEERGFEPRATAQGAQALLDAALEMLPQLGECALVDHWAGLRPASPDGLPSIGRLDERSWCATGHGRNGILLCPWTAQVLADAMLNGRELPRAFDPARLAKI